MKKIIQATENKFFDSNSVFLAGGISNCADWQTDVANSITSRTEWNVYNPRNPNFDSSNKKMEFEQISWEYQRLEKTDACIFWFCKETLCPITLFEYGKMLERYSKQKRLHNLWVGCHPEYARRNDVAIQTALLTNSEIQIFSSLDKLVDAFCYTRNIEKGIYRYVY